MFPSSNDGPGCVMTLDVWTKSQSSTPIRYHDGQPHRTARKDSFNFHARLNEGQLAVTLMPKAKDKTAFSHPYHLHSVLTELRKVWLTANPRKCHLRLTKTQYLGLVWTKRTRLKQSGPNNNPMTRKTGKCFFGASKLLQKICTQLLLSTPLRSPYKGTNGKGSLDSTNVKYILTAKTPPHQLPPSSVSPISTLLFW